MVETGSQSEGERGADQQLKETEIYIYISIYPSLYWLDEHQNRDFTNISVLLACSKCSEQASATPNIQSQVLSNRV